VTKAAYRALRARKGSRLADVYLLTRGSDSVLRRDAAAREVTSGGVVHDLRLPLRLVR
jgi:hypothetical protein